MLAKLPYSFASPARKQVEGKVCGLEAVRRQVSVSNKSLDFSFIVFRSSATRLCVAIFSRTSFPLRLREMQLRSERPLAADVSRNHKLYASLKLEYTALLAAMVY